MVDRFCPPDVHVVEEELRRQYRAVVAFIYIGATIIFGFALLNVKHHNYLAGGVQMASVGVVLAMLLVNRAGHPKVSAHVCVAMTTLTIFIGMWMGGGMSAAAIVFLPMVPAVGLLSVGQGGGVAGVLQAVGVVALVATLEKLGFEPRHDPPDKLFVKRVAEAVVVVTQIWLVCYLFFRLKNEAFALLSGKRDELAGLFDSMRQGVLAFGADGRVTGQYSQQAKEIFRRDRLDGVQVAELLYRNRPSFDLGRQEFATWLESMFFAQGEELAELLELAPQRCIVAQDSEDEQHLRLEFRPLIAEQRLVRVMLLVSDETERVRLKREADRQKVAGERALERMRRLAAGGAHAFLEALRAAETRVGSIEQTLAGATSELSVSEIDLMFRAAHTIKGEARLYDLDALCALAERLEDLLAQLRTSAADGARTLAPQVLAEAKGLLGEARAAIVAARDKLVEASPIGGAILDQVTVSDTDLRALRQQVMRMHMTLGEDATRLSEVTSRLLSRPFGASVAGLVDAVDRWSVQQGKRAVLALVGREIAIPPELHEVLPGALGHLARNALVHGIEAPDDRLRVGKPERGNVTISCQSTRAGPVIVVADDGAGVDAAELERRATSRGLSWDQGQSFELMFVDGLSTAGTVDALSGRGVGMSAARSDLRRVGYEIEVTSERGVGTRFTLRPRTAITPAGEPENDVTPQSERRSGSA
jgi:HPt (histidine-containing phosphotransfer) domain-containing protein